MDFTSFTDLDWNFFEAAVTVGLEAPDMDEDTAIEVETLVGMRVDGSRYTDDNAEVLREAFAIGWNVATENGTNELAERHRHVFEAVAPSSDSSPTPAQ